MLKWTTYDDTEATLPPHVSEVLLMRDPIYGLKLCLASTFREYAVPGWSWLPIPTEAECVAWERLRSWAKHEVESHGKSCECAICKALAALEADREGGKK